MDIDAWIRLSQVFAALFGIWMVSRTLNQKTDSDNRAEWWRRYTWAFEQSENQESNRASVAGWLQLDQLTRSDIATSTEASLKAALRRDILRRNATRVATIEEDSPDV